VGSLSGVHRLHRRCTGDQLERAEFDPNVWSGRAVQEVSSIWRSGGFAVLHQCIRPLIGAFCGKSQHEVRKLIAGPTVFICNECAALFGTKHRKKATRMVVVGLSSTVRSLNICTRSGVVSGGRRGWALSAGACNSTGSTIAHVGFVIAKAPPSRLTLVDLSSQRYSLTMETIFGVR
jgi:hypothetical protein